jgi:hypothetical protein
MAITGNSGNLRRTTGSNSKPDIPGMCKSEITIRGARSQTLRSASKPSLPTLASLLQLAAIRCAAWQRCLPQ